MTIITAPKNHKCRATKRACPFLDNSTSIPQLEKQMNEAIKEQDFGAYAELNEIKEKQEYINFQTESYAQKENLNNALIQYYTEQKDIIKSMYEKESKQEGTENRLQRWSALFDLNTNKISSAEYHKEIDQKNLKEITDKNAATTKITEDRKISELQHMKQLQGYAKREYNINQDKITRMNLNPNYVPDKPNLLKFSYESEMGASTVMINHYQSVIDKLEKTNQS